MLKNHCLAQSIGDVSWSMFFNQLEYKADWYGKTLLKIGQFEPSTKICNICGFHNKELTLKDRDWRCPGATRSYNMNCLTAIPSIRDNPTVECADGNIGVLSPQDNVESKEVQSLTNCQDKETMKSVMRTIVRVVTPDKRNGMIRLNQKVWNQTAMAQNTLR
jgi:hypothetical protein